MCSLKSLCILALSAYRTICDFKKPGIAEELESLSTNSLAMKLPSVMQEDTVRMNMPKLNCLISMGITSENVTQRFKVSHAEQDAFAVKSHQRAAEVIFGDDKLFAAKILPKQGNNAGNQDAQSRHTSL